MILAPTLSLLSTGTGAALQRPTFSRDFAGEKTLNNGTGPAITFTRASNATYFDASGTLQTAGNNVPRFDHDPATGASRGLLIEESRTNSIRNSQAGGSTNGVIGSGGALPTNGWSIGVGLNGTTNEVIGSGTENGLAYLDLKVSGTPTSNGTTFLLFESAGQVAASNGQTWVVSAYVKLGGGSASGATTRIVRRGADAGGVQVAGQDAITTFTATSDWQRVVTPATAFSSASIGSVTPFIRIEYTSGNPIDLTLRIAAPQLEQGAFATSYIPTTSAAVTRSADSAIVTPISSFYNQSEGTLFAEASGFGDGINTTSVAFAEDNNTNERFQLRLRGGGLSVVAAGVISAGTSNIAPATNVASKKAGAAKLNDFAISTNGAAVETDPAGNMPNVTHLVVGALSTSLVQPLNGHIRKIAYYPKRLSNALLEQLTT